jgi:rhodanese-related sulfurtransferase
MPDMIQREEVQRLLNSGGCLVEVLPEKEFKKVHLPRAINIPLQSLIEKRPLDCKRNSRSLSTVTIFSEI